MQKLNVLRDELQSLTTDLLTKINSRKNLVTKIQKEKTTTGEFKNFDLQREVALFNSLSDQLVTYSVKELFILSLLIENQAGGEFDYPSWSSQVHIEIAQTSIINQINPILLATFQKSRYDALQLNEKFKQILNPLLEK
jgi:chorismate mutase